MTILLTSCSHVIPLEVVRLIIGMLVDCMYRFANLPIFSAGDKYLLAILLGRF
jgi:hypothetical protein